MGIRIKCPNCSEIFVDEKINSLEDIYEDISCPHCMMGLYNELVRNYNWDWEEQEKKKQEEQQEKEKLINNMIVSTNILQNKVIEEYLGLVNVHSVSGYGGFFDFLYTKRSLIENILTKINKDALISLKEQAYKIGANAIFGVIFNSEIINLDSKKHYVVKLSVMGTAVRVKE